MKYNIEFTIFVSFIVLYLYFIHTQTFVIFTNSILGKLCLIYLILYYTTIDKIYGILVCLIIVLYYQLDSTRWLIEGFTDTSIISASSRPNLPNIENVVDIENKLPQREKTEFQKKHCSIEGTLLYKELPFKKDLASVVYPEIKYNDENNICNLCDVNCNYSIEPT